MYYPQQHPDDPRSKESAPPPYDPTLPPLGSNAYRPPNNQYGPNGYYGAYQQPPHYGYNVPPYGQSGPVYGYNQPQPYALPPYGYGPQAYPPPYGQPYPGYFPAMGYLPALWMPKATFWERFVARFIDGCVLFGACAVLFFMMAVFAVISPVTIFPMILLMLLVVFGYEVYFIGKSGATPGKKAMGIKVVDSYGQIPGYGRSLGRYLINILLSSQVFYLGYLWMLFDPQKQTWHDKIAGTYVVQARR